MPPYNEYQLMVGVFGDRPLAVATLQDAPEQISTP